jgi:2Fe-2S ferredoxin
MSLVNAAVHCSGAAEIVRHDARWVLWGMIEVTFIHPDGSRETHPAKSGDTVMDVALDNGVDGILAQCGGGCTCCTCHCWVLSPWRGRLAEPHQDELDMLEYAWGRDSRSRLACQVELTPELSGIAIRLPEEQA